MREAMRTAMHDIEFQLIRTTLSLVQAAASQEHPDIRDDILDDALVLLQTGKGGDSLILGRFCRDAAARLERATDSSRMPVARAIQRLLRIASACIPHNESPAVPSVRRYDDEPGLSAPQIKGRENRDAILAYIRAHAEVRISDLESALAGTVSGRTIKRALKELKDQKIVRRIQRDGAVWYASAE